MLGPPWDKANHTGDIGYAIWQGIVTVNIIETTRIAGNVCGV
jgi:hypothetical protein